MRAFRFVTLDVFADRPFAGNPLAVFPDAYGLSDAEMQSLARELNLAETTFVLPPTDRTKAAARVRIFTPFEELPYAGHPSVGTHWLLATEGRHAGPARGRTRIVQEVGAGLLPIDIDREDGLVVRVLSTQVAPVFGKRVAAADVAHVLGLKPEDVSDGEAVSTGIEWLLVPVRDVETLKRARLSADAPEKLRAWLGHNRIYPFAMQGFEAGALTAGRGLLAGEFEDPVTGSASGCLGAYLWKHGGLPPNGSFRHSQGHAVGRPGIVEIEVASDGTPRIGGRCVRVTEGSARLP